MAAETKPNRANESLAVLGKPDDSFFEDDWSFQNIGVSLARLEYYIDSLRYFYHLQS